MRIDVILRAQRATHLSQQEFTQSLCALAGYFVNVNLKRYFFPACQAENSVVGQPLAQPFLQWHLRLARWRCR
mgnify:CR=1 FL=1